MPVYTVHEPPLRGDEPLSAAERYVFVRDGFSIAAFLFAPFWMLWHRLWLALALYVVVTGLLETVLMAVGASPMTVTLLAALISLLVGLEAGSLRRLTLSRRGYKQVGLVSGADIEDAERRFFAVWVRTRSAAGGDPTAGAGARTAAHLSAPRLSQGPAVVGLFPEPGANR
ncbi:MAG TPA: DUF2628 domain-containing protein [Xanthobacteraceae bacterium]